MSPKHQFVRFAFILMASIAISGCAKAPPPPPAPKEPLIVHYEATADSVHVRDTSMYTTPESRGGAAIRQEDDKHVFLNTHYEAETNATKLDAWQKQLDASANTEQNLLSANSSDRTSAVKESNRNITQKKSQKAHAQGKDASIYRAKGKDASIYSKEPKAKTE